MDVPFFFLSFPSFLSFRGPFSLGPIRRCSYHCVGIPTNSQFPLYFKKNFFLFFSFSSPRSTHNIYIQHTHTGTTAPDHFQPQSYEIQRRTSSSANEITGKIIEYKNPKQKTLYTITTAVPNRIDKMETKQVNNANGWRLCPSHPAIVPVQKIDP